MTVVTISFHNHVKYMYTEMHKFTFKRIFVLIDVVTAYFSLAISFYISSDINVANDIEGVTVVESKEQCSKGVHKVLCALPHQ